MRKYNLLKLLAFLFAIVFCGNALAQPIPITTDSRIKTLVYNPNEVFELKFFYGYQSFIEFADGEEIEMISIGESFAWRITPAGKRLFIRPLEIAAHTNMTVITSKRTYHFDIKSGEYNGKADEELVYTVRFYYPQLGQPLPIPPQLVKPAPPKLPPKPVRRIVKTRHPKIKISDPMDDPRVLALEGNPHNRKLNFLYSMAGQSNNIVPLMTYDDGVETFFEFPGKNKIIPSFATVDDFGVETPVRHMLRDDFVVIPVVAKQITLRYGPSLLCVYNNKMLRK